MTLAAALPLPVILLIAGATAAPLLARMHRRAPLAVALLVLGGALAVLVVVAGRVYSAEGQVLTHFLSNEHPQHGKALGIAFAADPFGVAFALLVVSVGIVLVLSALSEFGDLGSKELGGFTCLVQLLLAALVGAALTADLINMFVWFEVAALSSYGLTGFFLERPIALEAAFKNLVLTSMAGFAVFLGAAMIYRTSGALNFGQVQAAVPAHPSRAELLAIALLVAGFATKAGLIPFHGWLPDAHTPVPGAVSALFSALMVGLGVVALARLALVLFWDVHALLGLLTALGLVSAITGALLALAQDDLKRLLAWDTVSQTGIIVAGLATRSDEGVAGSVYHLVNHGLFKALLFLCAGAVVHSTGITSLSEMGGLARRRPLITGGFLLGCAAIAGLPPLNGYASLGLLHEGLSEQPVAYGCALVAQVITVAALGRAAYLAFLRKRDEPYEHLEPSRLGMRISLITLSVGCIAFGVSAVPFVSQVADPAASALLHPAQYAAGELSNGSTLPALGVSFDYWKLSTLLTALGEIAVGLLLARFVLRRGTPRPITVLRRLHTGSVNDYAMFAASGLAITAAVLLT